MTQRYSRKMMTLENDSHIYINPLMIVVAGTTNVGKSTFIRLGLQNLISKHDSNRPDLQCHHTTIVLDQNNYPLDIIETHSDQLTLLTQPIHGGFVCYDTSNPVSMETVPELLDFFISRHIPVYLVGLKSDMASTHYPIHDIKHYQVNEENAEQMHHVFMSFLKEDLLLPDDYPKEVKTRPSTWDSMLSVQQDMTNTGLLYMVNKNRTHSSYYTHLSSRRGSKDSR
ncbi:hypothetical protein EDC96DRAFT_86827 [Choanephora cucurbitarum]|nr:hypothetical protein EDC96DRAFT_86827 [Choanephora cucurbitarum]